MDNRNDLWRHVDANKERLIALSERVWGMPEVCYTETRSSAEHEAELAHQGFRVTKGIADLRDRRSRRRRVRDRVHGRI